MFTALLLKLTAAQKESTFALAALDLTRLKELNKIKKLNHPEMGGFLLPFIHKLNRTAPLRSCSNNQIRLILLTELKFHYQKVISRLSVHQVQVRLLLHQAKACLFLLKKRQYLACLLLGLLLGLLLSLVLPI